MKMPPFINIRERKKLNLLLSKLEATTPALWGKMNAQMMIEHLINEVEYTNGKRSAALELAAEEATREKQAKVRDDFEIPKNIRGPSPDNSGKRFNDLPSAINALNKEIDRFEKFFQQEGQTAVHGGFGAMNHKEWILWHGKHFAHHFKQFGLLDD
jgi:hypothetical protein